MKNYLSLTVGFNKYSDMFGRLYLIVVLQMHYIEQRVYSTHFFPIKSLVNAAYRYLVKVFLINHLCNQRVIEDPGLYYKYNGESYTFLP